MTFSLSNIPRAYGWIAAGVLAVIGLSWFVWANYIQTYHLAVVQPGVLYRDGCRTFREFQTALGRYRVKQVISLVDDKEKRKEPFSLEEEYCRRSRIKYTPIPVKLGGWPTTTDVKTFLRAAQTQRAQPVLVHCAQGVRRTGMMVAAYQMSVLGWDKERTKAAILTFGHSQRTVGDVQKFIDVYNPQSNEVPTDLPQSDE
jgi:protein tyrosine/serine phosphatase